MGLDRKHRIEILDGTLSALRQGFYEKNGKQINLSISAEQMEECRVILPEEASIYAKSECDTLCFGVGTRATFDCINTDSVSAALELSGESEYKIKDNEKKEPLILNFADSFMPGGLVRSGAKAQEEDLCRQSSLLLSLESKAASEFYSHNRKNKSPLGTDAFILTPHVEIIRDRQGNFLDKPCIAAVLTCAAPDIRKGMHGIDKWAYRHLLRRRIEGMLKFASHEGYTKIVLGAWGCGVFGNPPEFISDVFYETFRNDNSKKIFYSVVFAVLDSSAEKKTFNEFYKNFGRENFWRDEDMEEIDQIHAEMRKKEKYLDKIQGCLIGGAAGDALGYAVEFINADYIFIRYGKNGITSYKLDKETGKALISDDTQMTLFTAAGILEQETHFRHKGICCDLPDHIEYCYLEWLRTQEISYKKHLEEIKFGKHKNMTWLCDVPELYSLRAPGNTCLSALEERRERKNSRHHEPGFIDNPLNDSKGCGGVMRAAPIGLVDAADINTLIESSAETAAITHGHPLGYIPAAMLSVIVKIIVFSEKKRTLENIIETSHKRISDYFKKNKYIKQFDEIIKLAIELSKNDKPDLQNIESIGGGWVGEEALAIAIYCALRHENDFSAGIIAAANHSGDSDSTAAIAGNILGALHGYSAIDEKWKTNLELHDVIMELATDLCHGCPTHEYSRYKDKDWDRKYIYCRWKE